ncbi:MAG: MoxR family ATPase [Planctomycetes bacterium]|nr:MoxR family ATPase [Planctomycetota bacterium]NOG53451.1 MoxR family ATPase [Planctomycetota bacterium]
MNQPTATDDLAAAGEIAERIAGRVSQRVVGMRTEIELLICAILADRHVLVEGVPGVGKTLLVTSLAAAMGCTFRRIQFTPDLLPSDILGGNIFDQRDASFHLRRGPVFANVILADEINRAPAKSQSALLEVMQERQVTIEGETIVLDAPFFVFATQNPIEHEGVYPLPQAQLDRFAMRLTPGYQSEPDEQMLLAAHRQPLPQISAATNPQEIRLAQRAVEGIVISDEILALIVRLCAKTRTYPEVVLGGSPRLGLDLLHLSRARALQHGRTHVLPDDIKALAQHVANHRIMLTPQAEVAGMTAEQIINDAITSTILV